MSSPFIVKEHKVPGQHIREYPHALANSQNDVLYLAVKEYIPRDNQNPQPGDVTILGAHANGFPKELYEPLWEDLYRESKSHGFRIRSIIIADAAWQGQSGIMNADVVGNDPSWLDYTRDILQVVNHLRPPTPIIGVAHSFGGAAITNLAHFNPRLLTSLILLDPVISPYASTPGSLESSPAAHSLRRRETWPSREEAAKSFAKSPFYKSWDPRVLNAWVTHGLTDVDSSGASKEVTLTTTKHQEVFTFLRPTWKAFDERGERLVDKTLAPDLDLENNFPVYPFCRPEPSLTLSRMRNIRPSVFYVLGEKSNLSHPPSIASRLRQTGAGTGGSGGIQFGRVKQVMLPGLGHLVAMEAPGECARLGAEWIEKEVTRWREGEAREFEEWRGKRKEEKTMLTEEWAKYLKVQQRAPKAKI
ncbi:Uncharacterized protein SAPIO_CDS9319 [Scedosporium apiospermum]|uniref:AB hydrolase-1 domain-containing protein n=1 Tax=Pseudallescheria apiosperma TaxID=563466 RepID=A0A084FWJ7_PSEDA|nr:Uncharacterized protein SAPIO_CDS9319 [Scedosporium apiospermum]KEZ39459.1 Uncharacterized protein SAPIO_CDS9319 [Scedosporium apiospermum]